MVQVQLLLLPFLHTGLPPNQEMQVNQGNLCSIREIQKRKKDFSKRPRESYLYCFISVLCLCLYSITRSIDVTITKVTLLSIILFCAAFMKHISVFIKPQILIAKNRANTLSSLVSVQNTSRTSREKANKSTCIKLRPANHIWLGVQS